MNKFNIGVIPRLLLFAVLSAAASTPLQLFNSIFIEKLEGPPSFVSVPFLVYAVSMKIVFGLGYVLFGHKLPIRNNILRAFSYIMLIFFSSYLPNILAMAGGDGEIIGASFSVNIVMIDTISYLMDGLILGLLMKKYAKEKPAETHQISNSIFAITCIVNGIVFGLLNIIIDIIAGLIDSSWRLCSILKVTSGREVFFNIVFFAFMFLAGLIQPVWFRYCMPESKSKTGLFGIEWAAITWLPCVLIMIFFGTDVVKTLTYGAVYVLMIVLCVLLYSRLSDPKRING